MDKFIFSRTFSFLYFRLKLLRAKISFISYLHNIPPPKNTYQAVKKNKSTSLNFSCRYLSFFTEDLIHLTSAEEGNVVRSIRSHDNCRYRNIFKVFNRIFCLCPLISLRLMSFFLLSIIRKETKNYCNRNRKRFWHL